jgi:hypothetical protein
MSEAEGNSEEVEEKRREEEERRAEEEGKLRRTIDVASRG